MAKHASDTSSMELSHYATVLRRRWRLVVLGLVAGVAAAAALVLVTPSTATSTTQVNVNVISSSLFNNARPASDLVDMQTEQAMARSTQVMTAVAEEMGADWTRSKVRQATNAVLLPDGTVLRIDFTAGSPEKAAEGATLVAEQYLAYRSQVAQGRVDLAVKPLVERSDALKEQLASANRKVAKETPGSTAHVSAELAADEVKAELAAVTSQINEIASVSTAGGEVLTEADPAQAATGPNRKLILLSGTLGGLLLGLVGAFVANVLDRRVRDAYDVAGAGGGDVVATLRGQEVALPAAGDDADELRAVRERLLSAAEGISPVLAVIDVTERTAAPTDVAAGLALALADSGAATDLVLAEYPPSVVESIADALRMSEVETHGRGRRFRGGIAESLTLLVPGSSRSRLSTSDLLAETLAEGARPAEVTVVALGPAAGSSVRLTTARNAHQCLLVAHELSTSIDQLADAATDLQAVWGAVHGTVLVPENRRFAMGSEPTKVPASRGKATSVPAPESAPEPTAPTSAEHEAAAERGRSASRSWLAAGASSTVEAGDDDPDQDSFPAPLPRPAPVSEVRATADRDPFSDPADSEPETPREADAVAEDDPDEASAGQGEPRAEDATGTGEESADDLDADEAASDEDDEHDAEAEPAAAEQEPTDEPQDESNQEPGDSGDSGDVGDSVEKSDEESDEESGEESAEESGEESAEELAEDTDPWAAADAAAPQEDRDAGPLPWAFER